MPTTTTPAGPTQDFELVSLCTAAEDYAANTRSFRVWNLSGEPADITLRNTETNQSITGTAPLGASMWKVPAGSGSNTTELIVDGQTVATSASNNVLCSVLHGSAQCDPASGSTTITWTVDNNAGSVQLIVSDTRGIEFGPNPDAPYGTSVGTEVIEGPPTDQQITETVTVLLSNGAVTQQSATVNAAACEGPALAADVTFTFTQHVSQSTAAVGDVLSYDYCGQNTSTIPLEVVRLVDDRLGVVIELPDVRTVVPPGGSLCSSDLGIPVTYTVTAADIGTTITSYAVVTVRTQEPTPREFQATATQNVDVPIPDELLILIQNNGNFGGGHNKVTICHSTGNGGFNQIEVDDDAVDDEGNGGHNRDSHQGGRDIIPPGEWDSDGRNWTPENELFWTNGCETPGAIPQKPTVTQATCKDGAVTTPTIVLASTLGIDYSLDPGGPYVGAKAPPQNVIVNADLQDGYSWGQIPPGWTRVNATRYTYTVELTAASCTVVQPANPTITQATCIRGNVTPPTLVLPTTDKITYTVVPTSGYVAGGTATVTATINQAGFGWPPTLPTGWVKQSNLVATYAVTFATITCTPVVPINPTVTQATCANGVVTTPTIVKASGPTGVLYFLNPGGPYEGSVATTVEVIARALPNYIWGQMPSGWSTRDVHGIPAGDRGLHRGQSRGCLLCDGHAGGADRSERGMRQRSGDRADVDAGDHRQDHLQRQQEPAVRCRHPSGRDGDSQRNRCRLAPHVAHWVDAHREHDRDVHGQLQDRDLHTGVAR